MTAAITILKDLLFSDYYILFDLESKQSMVETGESTVNRGIKSQQQRTAENKTSLEAISDNNSSKKRLMSWLRIMQSFEDQYTSIRKGS